MGVVSGDLLDALERAAHGRGGKRILREAFADVLMEHGITLGAEAAAEDEELSGEVRQAILDRRDAQRDGASDFVLVILTSGAYSDFGIQRALAVPRHEWEATATRLRALAAPVGATQWGAPAGRKGNPADAARYELAKAEEAIRLRGVALGGIDAHELHVEESFGGRAVDDRQDLWGWHK